MGSKDHIGADKLGEETTIDGVKARPLYSGSIENPDVLLGYLRVEGRKVYARSPKPEMQDWYLIYNFGLQPGEGEWVYICSYQFKPVTRTYMKFGRRPCAANPELQVMYIEEYLRAFGASETDEDPELEYCGQGRWLSGIGNMDGVTWNGYFEADGGGSRLLEVRRNDEPVFSDWSNVLISI